MTLAARLQRLLARHHTTQSEVADAAGMHRQQVGKILSGAAKNPGILTVERIVEAMGATMVGLYEDDGDQPGPLTSPARR